ncbi:MAG: hypothetical protein AAB795_03495 [Patescibacteria group bacterium]
MIPLISIVNLINFIIPGILSIRIYKIYKTNKSNLLFYFASACFFFSFYWLMGGLSGIIFNDLNIIGSLHILRFVFLYLALFFIIKIPLGLVEQKFLNFVFPYILIIGGISFISVGFWNFFPATVLITSPYIYWIPILPHWIEIMTGIFIFLVLSIFIITFVRLAWKDWSNIAVVRRSIFIIAGMGIIMIGGTLRFLTGGFFAFYFTYMLSTMSVSVGLLVIADGILYEHRHTVGNNIPDIKNES